MSLILSECMFLVSVNKTHVLSAIMLPNTKHIKSEDQLIKIKNKMNDVIAFHSTQKVTTGRLCLMNSDSKIVSMWLNSPSKPDSIKGSNFRLQKCRKRFNQYDLMDDSGEIRLHERQQEYLNSKLLFHAWAAVHNGHVVGLIAHPLIKNSIQHDTAFERYKSLARQALQTFGYVVACDVVITDTDEIKVYNIHESYERKGKKYPYFTRRLPTTSHLSFKYSAQVEFDIAV
ncbi:hypothetical protein AMD27_17600 (plasmid) [Acinetobacter sp. TGL-Y2]|uniref:hypothetical protein n=1 Tax=Acinetobacter sp. TGL-Y2 TaxID=1407071 RepID=UPI0007A66F02|nr:hypothetical protein [Acinetobacter sp. TGL-Y2]AMW80731.1 hypothetical protein AMD27_17600 [Acinetobacter sp. TGL-Y2]